MLLGMTAAQKPNDISDSNYNFNTTYIIGDYDHTVLYGGRHGQHKYIIKHKNIHSNTKILAGHKFISGRTQIY